MRTATTADHVNVYAIQSEFDAFVMDPEMKAKFLPNAVWAANKWLAEKYRFGLYVGIPDELFREV